MAANAEESEITIELAVESDLPPIEMNARHARQLWTNLISNAIKYSNRGGTVHVSLACKDQRLVGAVSDQGIGIAADELALIFEEFYRSKASKKHTQMGTGLGLPIVKRILDSYGGTIDLASEEDKGSTFTFTIPLPQSLACAPVDTVDTPGT